MSGRKSHYRRDTQEVGRLSLRIAKREARIARSDAEALVRRVDRTYGLRPTSLDIGAMRSIVPAVRHREHGVTAALWQEQGIINVFVDLFTEGLFFPQLTPGGLNATSQRVCGLRGPHRGSSGRIAPGGIGQVAAPYRQKLRLSLDQAFSGHESSVLFGSLY